MFLDFAMKRYFIILVLLCSILFNQDRSTIFNTGSPPDLANGYPININNSVANKLVVPSNYVLEAMAFYVTAANETSNNIIVSIREDDNGIPGSLVTELAQWDYNVTYPATNGYNLIVTTDLCVYLDSGNTYWWTIQAGNLETDVLWAYSGAIGYEYATSNNGQWSASFGYAAAGGVWAEQIFDSPYNLGDVNFDFLVNVVDIVQIVGHVLDTNILSDESIEYADINSDSNVDVVDIVQLINLILTESPPNSDFTLEDINPASEYFTQNIGPSFFDGKVSVYYFGKQG